ncbi:transposase [Gloeocapsopsis crepidinum LEGE 06123]|uniref:Transposase n=1 Tax=Gloeocapsopsis crepidinum LEGE 06123 TaxID=588587 RepID=A0ABR9UYI8_9CHRO|nr:DUF6262 family protein [Gloeocapsopsis crepidinum]MBE9193357.1 transposase [Gloeocapsopsis crepidinum LEGE 06123]
MNRVDTRESRIDTLKKTQESRKQNCLERVYKAIECLQKIGAKINFHTVAKEANLSVSYLYKYPELKQQVAQIRSQQSSMPVSPGAKTSSSSHAKVVSRFKERIHQLEAQNQELRCKNEALAGQVYRVHYLQEQVERQQQTIEDLTTRLKESQAQASIAKVVPIAQVKNLYVSGSIQEDSKSLGKCDKIQFELDTLGIKVNSTLAKLIKTAPEEIVLKAIDTLKESLAATKVRNASGFLVEAIRNTWIPNQGYEQKIELDAFKEWYPLAQSLQLVLAAAQFDGVQHVLTLENQWVPFEQMASDYPLEKLREMA